MSEQLTPTQRVRNETFSASQTVFFKGMGYQNVNLTAVPSAVAEELATELERVRAALSGRTVSCDACNQTATERDQLKRQVEAEIFGANKLMRENDQLRAQNAELANEVYQLRHQLAERETLSKLTSIHH